MGSHQSKWMSKMIETHGSEEAVSEFMRQTAAKSKRNKGGKGGFASMDKEKLQEVASKGGQSSRRGKTSQAE